MLFQSMLSSDNPQPEDKYYDANLATAFHAINPLTIPTADGSGQSVHPGVEVAENGISWNGYKYWLVVAPYPNSNNDFENPTVIVSDDLVNWAVPIGGSNPITPEPSDGSHHADNDLFWDYDGSLVCIFHGFTNGALTGGLIYYMRSYDGITWTPKAISYEDLTDGGTGLSPTIIKENGGYTMWSERTSGASGRQFVMQTSIDFTDKTLWSSETNIVWKNMPKDRDLWHAEVTKIRDGEYHIIAAISDAAVPSSNTNEYFGVSADGINFTLGSLPILGMWNNVWDNLPYRATGIWRDGYYDMIYSAQSGSQIWNQGLTQITFTGNEIVNNNPPVISTRRPSYSYRFWINPTYKNRINFETDEPLAIGDDFSGFVLTGGKNIIEVHINPKSIAQHWFVVDSDYGIGEEPTILYNGVATNNESNISDGEYFLSDFPEETVHSNIS